MTNTKHLHIGMVCQTLTLCRGGRERICCRLANHLARNNHTVTIFCIDPARNPPQYPLLPQVNVIYADSNDNYGTIHQTRTLLRSLDLDVCVVLDTSKYHLFWAVALMGTGIPYIYSEHIAPDEVERRWSRKGRLAAMSGADAIRLMLPEYMDSIPEFLRERTRVIQNSVPDVAGLNLPSRPVSPPYTLLSLGRIAPIKQVPLLIKAFERLAPEFPDWELHIWGSLQEDDEASMRLAESSPAKSAIHFRGVTEDPLSLFSAAHLFCIPSHSEGVPNSLLEAMACGLPAVGFAECPGVNHIIRHGYNGLLVPEMNEECLAKHLQLLMKDPELRKTYSQNAPAIRQQLPEKIFLEEWEKLLRDTAKCKGKTRMDAFREEEFAARSTLSAAAKREWLFTDFGQAPPKTFRRDMRLFDKAVADLRATIPGPHEVSVKLPSIAVCVIFFEKWQQTVECITSFLSSGVPIHVLNNGSSAQNSHRMRMFCQQFPNVHLHESSRNIGAAAGRNLLSRRAGTDWIFFADNDITVQQGTWLPIAAHYIAHLDKAVQAFTPRYFHLETHRGVGYLFPRQLFTGHNQEVRNLPPSLELSNYAPSGAVIINREAFEALGGFDEELHNFEDIELSARAAAGGADLRVIAIPEIRLVHEHLPAMTAEDSLAAQTRYSTDLASRSAEQVRAKLGVSMAQYVPWQQDRLHRFLDYGEEGIAQKTISPGLALLRMATGGDGSPSFMTARTVERLRSLYPELRSFSLVDFPADFPRHECDRIMENLADRDSRLTITMNTPAMLPCDISRYAGSLTVVYSLDSLVEAGNVAGLAPFLEVYRQLRGVLPPTRCKFSICLRRDRIDHIADILAQCGKGDGFLVELAGYSPKTDLDPRETTRLLCRQDNKSVQKIQTLCRKNNIDQMPPLHDPHSIKHTCDTYLTTIAVSPNGDISGCLYRYDHVPASGNIFASNDPYNGFPMCRLRTRAVYGCSPHASCQFCFYRTARPDAYPAPTREDVELVLGARMFDESFYRSNYLHGRPELVPPLEHFLRHGALKGYKPHAGFDPFWYLAAYPDVAAMHINPLLHYIRFGRDAGYQTKPSS